MSLAENCVLETDLALLSVPVLPASISPQHRGDGESAVLLPEPDQHPGIPEPMNLLVLQETKFGDLYFELQKSGYTSLTLMSHYLQLTQQREATSPSHPVDG